MEVVVCILLEKGTLVFLIKPAFLLTFNDRFPWKQLHLQMKKVSRTNQQTIKIINHSDTVKIISHSDKASSSSHLALLWLECFCNLV